MQHSPTGQARDIWIRLLLYPGHTLPTAAAPVAVAAGLAYRGGLLAPLPLAIAFAASWLIHVGGVFFDNHELLRRHPDLPEHPELIAALQQGTLALGTLRVAIWSCFALALLCTPYLFAVGGPPVLLFGALGVAASLSYAGGPLAYARFGLAEPFFFLMFGVVAVCGAFFIQAAAHGALETRWLLFPDLPPEAYLVGLPVGALVTCVLIIDDIRDREFDRVKGWRTGTVRFGLAASRYRFTALMAAAYGAPVVFRLGADFDAWILLPLVTLPQAIRILRRVMRQDRTPDLLPMSAATSRLSLAYAALLAIGIALG